MNKKFDFSKYYSYLLPVGVLLVTIALIPIVIIPEFLRFINLPASMLGSLRNVLYGILLIVIIYYSIDRITHKRHV